MKKITALRKGKGRGKRINIYLDGRFAFSMGAEAVVKAGLREEQDLSDQEIESLSEANKFERCYEAALLFLSYRPRSEPEIRTRLRQRGYDAECIDESIIKLKRLGYVDDAAFARFWTENRESFSPRSRQLTRMELRQKGIAEDIINQAVTEINEEDSAYRAALKKARSLPTTEFESFRRRLGEYLRRRGFGYGVIDQTVKRIWQEKIGSSA